MEREQAKELWSRLVSGEALTAAEETLLLNRLLERPVLRREFVEDATLDSELRCLARLDSPKDDFLQGFAKKLSEDRGLFLFNRFPADGGGPKKRWIAVAVAVLCVTFLPAGIALWLRAPHVNDLPAGRGPLVAEDEDQPGSAVRAEPSRLLLPAWPPSLAALAPFGNHPTSRAAV